MIQSPHFIKAQTFWLNAFKRYANLSYVELMQSVYMLALKQMIAQPNRENGITETQRIPQNSIVLGN